MWGRKARAVSFIDIHTEIYRLPSRYTILIYNAYAILQCTQAIIILFPSDSFCNQTTLTELLVLQYCLLSSVNLFS